ncbi:MAG TPA: hypothetical protein ENJ84_02865 [Gammaproteobacteria bacterium]|nr:hypothetical protein [Gammaproteobacteria bacterium]
MDKCLIGLGTLTWNRNVVYRLFLIILLLPLALHAAEYQSRVPMSERDTATFYVTADINGQQVDLLVDTGASYSTLHKGIIDRLKQQGHARRTGEVEGILANGDSCILPIYHIKALTLGGCLIEDIEVAETPENTRNLLGLSVLRKAAPFIFSLEPAELKLSHCEKAVSAATTRLTEILE